MSYFHQFIMQPSEGIESARIGGRVWKRFKRAVLNYRFRKCKAEGKRVCACGLVVTGWICDGVLSTSWIYRISCNTDGGLLATGIDHFHYPERRTTAVV